MQYAGWSVPMPLYEYNGTYLSFSFLKTGDSFNDDFNVAETPETSIISLVYQQKALRSSMLKWQWVGHIDHRTNTFRGI